MLTDEECKRILYLWDDGQIQGNMNEECKRILYLWDAMLRFAYDKACEDCAKAMNNAQMGTDGGYFDAMGEAEYICRNLKHKERGDG